MARFECVRCGNELTGPLRQVPRPWLAGYSRDHGDRTRRQLLEPGTFAIWSSGSAEDATVYACGPGSVFGARFVIEYVDGPRSKRRIAPDVEMACSRCGALVGGHIDDYGAPIVTRLESPAVRLVEGVVPQHPDTASAVREAELRELLGEGPGDRRRRDRTSEAWRDEVILCLADTLVASGGRLVAPVGSPVRAFAAIGAAMAGPARFHALPFPSFPAPGVTAAERLLDAVDHWNGPDGLTLLSFERSPDVLTASAAWLTARARSLGRDMPELRLVNVAPRTDEMAAPPVRTCDPVEPLRTIGLAGPVWRYLVRAAAADRVLAGTRWRKAGLAEEVDRDDPLRPDLVPAGIGALAWDLHTQAWKLGWALRERTQRTEVWADHLIERLRLTFRRLPEM
jgi:hypothetical protein